MSIFAPIFEPLFGKHRARIVARLNAAAEVVETARGPVEFARRGAPPYVLIMHGTPQGHHASFIGEPLEAAGFGTLTPSRPGYLRTPITTGRTPAEQAAAAAALLDALDIAPVAVYGISGGGPSSIEFAARHPDKAQALILEVAIAKQYAPEVSDLTVALTMNPITFWIQELLLRHAPRLVVSQLVKFESTLGAADRNRITTAILADPQKLALLRNLLDGPTFDLLRTGFQNDMKQFAAIEQLPLDQIRCPTLVAHGTHDGDVPFAHAEHAVSRIPGAELLQVDKGWHLLALSNHAEAVRRTQIDFLRQHLSE